MHYLIDGYNLLFFLADAIPHSAKNLDFDRKFILSFLEEAFTRLSLEGTLIFDGKGKWGGESGLSYKGPLHIAYTFSGESADAYILDRIRTSRSFFTVVSNDRFLTASARKEKVPTLSLPAFLRLLKKKPIPDCKPESIPDFDFLLKTFEEKLRQSF